MPGKGMERLYWLGKSSILSYIFQSRIHEIHPSLIIRTMRSRLVILILCWVIAPSAFCPAYSQSLFVSTAGDDSNPGTEARPWRHIQHACDSASAGDTVFVKGGVYNEKITVNISGNSAEGFITFIPYQSETVILDGSGITGDQLILIRNKNYVRFEGFELRNNLNQTFGTGIWVQGFGDYVELRNNRIHDMRAASGGGDAMGISVYGSDPALPISHVIIEGNVIFNCEPGHSESLTLNGNVDTFSIVNNVVHDVNNIGIDMIGGEGTSSNSANDFVRNGACRGNTVYRARSIYGGGYAAGIYVDGGQNILIERNIVHDCDVGLEIGCENHGKIASGMIVRENLLYNNDKRGLSFGGYNYPATGTVTNSVFLNNTVFNNDVLKTDEGELYVEYAQNCIVKNNIFYSSDQNKLITTAFGKATGNVFDYNFYYSPVGEADITIDWNGTVYTGFDNFRNGTGQDSHSAFGDPQFVSASVSSPDLHLQSSSPAINAGDTAFAPASGEVDFEGSNRIVDSRVDAGAYEYHRMNPSPPVLLAVEGSSSSPILRWHASPLAVAYHVQVSGDTGFSTILYDDSTVSDTVVHVPALPESVNCYWRVSGRNSNGEGGWSDRWSFNTTPGSFSLTVTNKWNLVSLPIIVSDPDPGKIFPTAVSGIFAYDGTYVQKETVWNGVGYWIKFNGSQNVSISGSPVASDTIDVNGGWNLIGSISNPVASSAVVPLGLIFQSSFYAYNKGYVQADTLYPGKGYWIKADTAGKIVLEISKK
jgi:hypothetical protein